MSRMKKDREKIKRHYIVKYIEKIDEMDFYKKLSDGEKILYICVLMDDLEFNLFYLTNLLKDLIKDIKFAIKDLIKR